MLQEGGERSAHRMLCKKQLRHVNSNLKQMTLEGVILLEGWPDSGGLTSKRRRADRQGRSGGRVLRQPLGGGWLCRVREDDG